MAKELKEEILRCSEKILREKCVNYTLFLTHEEIEKRNLQFKNEHEMVKKLLEDPSLEISYLEKLLEDAKKELEDVCF